MPRPLRVFSAAAATLLLGCSPAWAQQAESTVYVSIVDRSGRPVSDVTAEQLTIVENNLNREVLRLARVVEPLDIAVLVDTSEDAEPVIAEVRRGLLEFVKALGDRHNVAIVGFGQRPTVLVDYTRDPRRLETGIGRVFAQTGSGAYLLDGVIETARGLRTRERSQREVIVIAIEGQEFGTRNSKDVLDEVRRSDVVVDSFVITDRPSVPREIGNNAAQSLPIALPDPASLERNTVLTESPRITGGRRVDLVTSTGIGPGLRELAIALNNQYRVVYEGASRGAFRSIEVLTTRPDLKIDVRGIPQSTR